MQGACLVLQAPWEALAMQPGSKWPALKLPEHAALCPEHCPQHRPTLAPAYISSQGAFIQLSTFPDFHARWHASLLR